MNTRFFRPTWAAIVVAMATTGWLGCAESTPPDGAKSPVDGEGMIVSVTSSPSEAHVQSALSHCTTPCSLAVPPGESITVERLGYEPQKVQQGLEDGGRVNVTLVPIKGKGAKGTPKGEPEDKGTEPAKPPAKGRPEELPPLQDCPSATALRVSQPGGVTKEVANGAPLTIWEGQPDLVLTPVGINTAAAIEALSPRPRLRVEKGGLLYSPPRGAGAGFSEPIKFRFNGKEVTVTVTVVPLPPRPE